MGYKTLDHYSIHAEVIDLNLIDKFIDQSKIAKDAEDPTTSNMLVRIDATRSGSVVNRRMYTSKSVEAKAQRFITPTKKPFIKDHAHGNVDATIGRMEDSTFYRLEKDDNKFFNDFLFAKDKGRGSGGLNLDVRIIDSDARQKIIDKRYLTVSTGQELENIRCSHCEFDPTKWGSDCLHYPGQVAELTESSLLVKNGIAKAGKEMPMYLITDIKDYLELSQVNIPAQQFSMIKQILEDLNDSQLSDDQKTDICELFVSSDFARVGNCLTDAVLEDSNGMRQGLLVKDYEDHVNRTVTGKTTVKVPRPAGSNNQEDLSDANEEDNSEENLDTDTGSVDNKNESQSVKEDEMSDKKDDSTSDDVSKILTEANATLKSDNASLEKDLEKSKDSNKKLAEDLDKVSKSLIDSQADLLLTIRKVAKHQDLDDLEEDKVNEYGVKLQSRSIDSLKDSIDDEKAAFYKTIEDLGSDQSGNFSKGDVKDPTVADTDADEPKKKKTQAKKKQAETVSDSIL